eukprot:scaffold23654_cov75-Phaeocystis_antarctica.AAC.3
MPPRRSGRRRHAGRLRRTFSKTQLWTSSATHTTSRATAASAASSAACVTSSAAAKALSLRLPPSSVSPEASTTWINTSAVHRSARN